MLDKNEKIFMKASITTKTLQNDNCIRMLCINAPYTIINSLPFDMRVYFRPHSQATDIIYQNPNIADLLLPTPPEPSPPIDLSSYKNDLSKKRGRYRVNKGKLGTIEEKEEDESDSGEEFYDAEEWFKPTKHFEYLDLRSFEEVSVLDLN